MKKQYLLSLALSSIIMLSSGSFAGDTHSGQAVEEASKAGSHASASAAHSVAAGGQVTSAASAVPLIVSGAAGAVSGEVGKELMESATAPIGAPLEITDETIMAGPAPDKALAPTEPKKTEM
jgi:hypothetical protein